MLVRYNTTKWREMDFSGVDKKFGYPVYSIERAQLHHVLLETAGGVEAIHWGSKVTDIIDDASASHVVVRTAAGEEFCSGVVIGADGIRSVT